MRRGPSTRPVPESEGQHGRCKAPNCTSNAINPFEGLPLWHAGRPGVPCLCREHGGGPSCEIEGCRGRVVQPREGLPLWHAGKPGVPGRCAGHGGGAGCEIEGCLRRAILPRTGLPSEHAGRPGLPGRCGEHEGGAGCEFEDCLRRAAHPRRGLLRDAAAALHGVPGCCGHHGGGGHCWRAEGHCGHVAYRDGLCRGHSVCDCIDGATQPCAISLTPPPLAPHADSLLLTYTSRHFLHPTSRRLPGVHRAGRPNTTACSTPMTASISRECASWMRTPSSVPWRARSTLSSLTRSQASRYTDTVEGIQLRTGVRPGLTSLAS